MRLFEVFFGVLFKFFGAQLKVFWRPVKGGLTNLVQALTAPPIANKCSHQGPEWETFSEKGDDGDDDGKEEEEEEDKDN